MIQVVAKALPTLASKSQTRRPTALGTLPVSVDVARARSRKLVGNPFEQARADSLDDPVHGSLNYPCSLDSSGSIRLDNLVRDPLDYPCALDWVRLDLFGAIQSMDGWILQFVLDLSQSILSNLARDH